MSPATDARQVSVVVPEGIDDPKRPSGGNTYDRRVCHGLAAIGWSVSELAVAGAWPSPDAAASAALGRMVAALPDGAIVLLDGLIASAVPQVLVPQAGRLRLVVLVHMPLDDRSRTDDALDKEHAVLRAAASIITTSTWSRRLLIDRHGLPWHRIQVAEPGVDVAEVAPGTPSGAGLLCVAAVAPHKGHDVLFEALGRIADLSWRCRCAGTLERDPGFVERLERSAELTGIEDRVHFAGPLTGGDLDAAYAAADVLVLASHSETFGMVITEALAHGVPVIASDVGGLPEALGRAPDGQRPGLLVPAGDSAALAAALRSWLTDGDLRRRLRHCALARRKTLARWSVTSDRISQVLAGVAGC